MRLKQIRSKDLLRALVKTGFVIRRQSGSHVFLEGQVLGEKRFTSISIHPGTLPKGTLVAIIKQTRLTEEQLQKLLK